MTYTKCEDCWARYWKTAEHKCDGLMKMLVQKYKNSKRYRHAQYTKV